MNSMQWVAMLVATPLRLFCGAICWFIYFIGGRVRAGLFLRLLLKRGNSAVYEAPALPARNPSVCKIRHNGSGVNQI